VTVFGRVYHLGGAVLDVTSHHEASGLKPILYLYCSNVICVPRPCEPVYGTENSTVSSLLDLVKEL